MAKSLNASKEKHPSDLYAICCVTKNNFLIREKCGASWTFFQQNCLIKVKTKLETK